MNPDDEEPLDEEAENDYLNRQLQANNAKHPEEWRCYGTPGKVKVYPLTDSLVVMVEWGFFDTLASVSVIDEDEFYDLFHEVQAEIAKEAEDEQARQEGDSGEREGSEDGGDAGREGGDNH